MTQYSQRNRPLAITTPLGADVLLLKRLHGTAALSELFRYDLKLLAPRGTRVPFERLMGQEATVRLRLPDDSERFFHGLISRVSRGKRDQWFTHYRAKLVPRLWLLTRNVQCRIFQQKTIPQILQAVLERLGRPNFRLALATTYPSRDYCVQYNESDFVFLSRLMEEEGIFYYFEHTATNHVLVITDQNASLPALPDDDTLLFDDVEGGVRDGPRITEWKRTQEVRAGSVTLWDQCFELAAAQDRVFQNLEGKASLFDGNPGSEGSASAAAQKLRVAASRDLEMYEYPSGCAKRFDGIAPGGAGRADDLQHILPEVERMATLRLEAEAAQGLQARGASDCGQLEPGYRFNLGGDIDEDLGRYLVTRVKHTARASGFRSGEEATFDYHNRFACLPDELAFRPARQTPKPSITGVQTATVVGLRPTGADGRVSASPLTGADGQRVELPPYTDKYGRVKVQFHWDRQGRFDLDSSCWIRVSQLWAGNRSGAFFWPRPGHEVVVSFEDGDPDQPLIVGSVYNTLNLPPMDLDEPGANWITGFKTASLLENPMERFNGLTFNDEPGNEFTQMLSATHDALLSEASRFVSVLGPIIESVGALASRARPILFNGRNYLSPLGLWEAAGGGSKAEAALALARAYKVPPEALGVILMNRALRRLALLLVMPGKSSMVSGDQQHTTILGKDDHHTLWGSNVRCVFESPWSLASREARTKGLFEILSTKALLKTFGKIAVAGGLTAGPLLYFGHKADAKAMAATIAALFIKQMLPSPTGSVEMVFGQKLTQVYQGPKVEIGRCRSYTFHDASTLLANVDGVFSLSFLAKLLVTLTHLATVASDFLSKIFNDFGWAGLEGEGETFAESTVSLTSGTAASMLHGILIEVEKFLAEREVAKTELAEAKRQAMLAIYYLEWSFTRPALLEDLKENVLLAKNSVHAGSDVMKDLTTLIDAMDNSFARTSQVYNSTYSMTAHSVVVATEDRRADPSGEPALGPGGTITLTARSSTDKNKGGLINLNAANRIQLQCNSSELRLGTGEDEKSILLANASPGKITIAQGEKSLWGPVIELSDNGPGGGKTRAIRLEAAALLTTSEIEVSDKSIEVRYGVGLGAESSIVLKAGEISLSVGTTTKIELAADGIKINGLKIDIDAVAELAMKASMRTAKIKTADKTEATLRSANIRSSDNVEAAQRTTNIKMQDAVKSPIVQIN